MRDMVVEVNRTLKGWFEYFRHGVNYIGSEGAGRHRSSLPWILGNVLSAMIELTDTFRCARWPRPQIRRAESYGLTIGRMPEMKRERERWIVSTPYCPRMQPHAGQGRGSCDFVIGVLEESSERGN